MMYPERKVEQAPLPTQGAPVTIRKYDSLTEFQTDAATMASAGWHVAAQSSGSGLSSAGQWCVALGIVMTLGGLVVHPFIVLIGIVLVIIGAFARQSTFTVTYQPKL